jgi:hypothetical protein
VAGQLPGAVWNLPTHLLRQFEYQAALAGPFAKPGVDPARLRRELGMGGE